MRNLVVLCLDSVRKDFYDVYARRLRARADYSWEQCRAASSWSIPSHASLLTGDLPHEHGVHTHDRDYSSLSVDDTLLAAVPDHEHVGVSSNPYASDDFGFDRLFDEFVTVPEARRFPRGLDPTERVKGTDDGIVRDQLSLLWRALNHERPVPSLANALSTYVDAALRRLPTPRLFDGATKPLLRECDRQVERADEPFLLFVNFMESHLPLEPTIGYDQSLHGAPPTFSTADTDVWELMGKTDRHERYLRLRRGLYGASIEYLDRLLDAFVTSLHDATARETTVVVTADHGENLGYPADDGLVRHKSSLSEGLLHVPCDVLNAPEESTSRPGRYVSHLDFERLVPALGHGTIERPGRDVVAAELIGMSAGPEPPSDRQHWDRMQRAVYEGPTKFVADSTGRVQRYDLADGRPCWQSPPIDVDAVPDHLAARFAVDVAAYKRTAANMERDREPPQAVEHRLRELGYR